MGTVGAWSTVKTAVGRCDDEAEELRNKQITAEYRERSSAFVAPFLFLSLPYAVGTSNTVHRAVRGKQRKTEQSMR